MSGLALWTAGRASAFFVAPARRTVGPALSSSFSFSTTKGDPPIMRRSRPKRTAAASAASMGELQRLGKVPSGLQFTHGSLEPGTSSSSSSTSLQASSLAEEQGTDEIQFPLQGKTVDELAPRMRFAPSPTGSLHVGGARTALYNWLVAKKGQLDFPGENGAFVLRVEDTDIARSTKESEDSVLADLTWLGLNWDEGPDNALAQYGPYRQSERGQLYTKGAKKLMEEGKAYPCFSTKEELEQMKEEQEKAGIPPRYDGTWRDADPELVRQKMEAGDEFTVRFKVPPGARIVIDDAVRGTVSWDAEATVGDFILLRSSGIPVYNFCVAVDDATMGITTVIRAEEHLTNTLRQGLILDALGAPRPKYAHCSLILGEDKQKLSKRHGATSCDQFRLDGFLPDAMINYLALLGWNDGTENEIFTRDELVEAFDINRIVKSPSVFDMDKLKWVNSQHLKMTTIEDLMDLVKQQMDWKGIFHTAASPEKIKDFVFASTAVAKQMMETTQDAATNAQTVLGYGLPASFDNLKDREAKLMIEQGNFYPIAQTIIAQVEASEFPMPDPDNLLAAFRDENKKLIEEDSKTGGSAYSYPQAYKAHMKALAKETGAKGKNLFHPVRLALTGEMSGQDVTKQLSLLAMAEAEGAPIDPQAAQLKSFQDRLQHLKAFCETIPEQFRAPASKEDGKNSSKGSSSSAGAASSSPAEGGTGAAAASVADPLSTYDGPPISALDIRVGRIQKVWTHEEADKLYCEEIDVGEDEPRMIASGLRPYLKEEDMEGKLVLVLCNLKARNLVGFPSHGMVLCASNADHTEVKLVNPPVDAKIGERVTVPDMGFEDPELSAPFAENKVGKKKVFEKLAPFLVTSKYGVPEFFGRPFMTSAGVCTSPIPDGTVS
eukprot:CAMPEP_0198282450 /NCGR_PEP_ID=MMETSP1449-20131203/2266_1 /TAXON_ID=420275 /ORGANISM="Attheya septentrionalis, Strain CCMP2084" /LENGTH=888 /DNA_ID=CAMNT_0043978709 /DNA_START=183 /DNA_END=2849 /DNA_ORIENTATION=-